MKLEVESIPCDPGSDDAVGPYFPSSVLGSRHDVAGSESGIYTKRGKGAAPVASAVDPPLPTIQERATPVRCLRGMGSMWCVCVDPPLPTIQERATPIRCFGGMGSVCVDPPPLPPYHTGEGHTHKMFWGMGSVWSVCVDNHNL